MILTKKREDCINKVTVEYKCFKHKFCRICLETDGATFVSLIIKTPKKIGFLEKKNLVQLI